MNRPCISCHHSLNRSNNRIRRSNAITTQYVEQYPFILDYLVEVRNIREIGNEDRICRPCFQQAGRYIRQRELDAGNVVVPEQFGGAGLPQINPAEFAQPTQNVVVRFPIQGFSRAPFNTRQCLFQQCENGSLIRINKSLRSTVLQELHFYIPLGARVCEQHRYDPAWIDITLVVRHVYNLFTPRQVGDMLRLLKNKNVFINFERLASIPDDVFHFYIGFSKQQFTEILESTPSISGNHSKPASALATLLVKLHTGEPNERLCKLFKMKRSTFENKMRSVRDYLMLEFVPRHLGYNHITREQVISRCLSIPKALFGGPNGEDRSIVIHDGTYIYLQRSTNYFFQRKSYSLHKWRQLYKPYLMVCPDGHIIDIYGPCDATTSDAAILSGMLRRPQDPFHWFYRPNDIFILDRGFRDALDELESAGYSAKVPITRSRTATQLTTDEANESRKVTMCRWVVETVNGRLKNQFKLLRNTANNRALGHLFNEIKIAGALLNAFGRPLTDHRLVEDILREIENRSTSENALSNYIIAKNINARRAIFHTITANEIEVSDFPRLTIDDLIIYALGTYQLKQARSYYGEHIKADGAYRIEVCRDVALQDIRRYNITATNPWLLRGRIQSRHRQSRTYYTYILVEGDMQGRQAIHSQYCSCIVGKRTLGCCSHIMSILWYLGWGKYQINLTPPALLLDNIIIRHDVELESSDEN